MFYTWNQTDRVIRTKTATEIGIVLVVFVNIVVENNIKLFTPLKISNGTPKGRLARYLRETLPINELGFRNAKPIGHKGIRRIPESPQLKGNPPEEDCPIQQVYEIFIGVYYFILVGIY